MSPRRDWQFPHNPADPRLKRCKECSDRWMPGAFCKKHKHRCLTCCSRLQANCGLRALTPGLEKLSESTQKLGESMEALSNSTTKAAKAYTAAQIKADIDALYGKDGER